MVKVSDCTCCDCESATEKEQIKERALSSINKVYTFDNRTFWPDGTGMVTIPLPTQEQLNKIETVGDLTDQVAKNTAGLNTANELIAGEQTQIDSLKTTLETSYQAIVQKGSANGYAGLDNNARVPLAQLYAGTSANQVPLIGKQLLANEMLVVDADGLTVRSKPIVQTLSFRGIYPAKSALPSEGNVSGDYAIVSDGTAQDDTGYYVWGYNTATSEYEWVWTILFDANSYQLISNLVTEISDSSDDSHYPSAKAVKDYHDASVGTLEQEIDTINTDIAGIQQTVNTHTTEITAVNTLANRAYDDAEISGDTITLSRGNGGTTQIVIPSGDTIPLVPFTSSYVPTNTTTQSLTTYIQALTQPVVSVNLRYIMLQHLITQYSLLSGGSTSTQSITTFKFNSLDEFKASTLYQEIYDNFISKIQKEVIYEPLYVGIKLYTLEYIPRYPINMVYLDDPIWFIIYKDSITIEGYDNDFYFTRDLNITNRQLIPHISSIGLTK